MYANNVGRVIATLTDNTFANNVAGEFGGGVHAYSGSGLLNVTVRGGTLRDNRATCGGGMSFYGIPSYESTFWNQVVTISDSVFLRNLAPPNPAGCAVG